MSTLFVDRRDAHLEFDAGALVFREGDKHGERIGTVPLAPLRRVFLRGNLTLQASLLGKLGEQGVGVVVLSGRIGKPSLFLGRPHHDARRRVAQTRHSLDAAFCLDFARQLVQTKLARQHAWLDTLRDHAPHARRPLTQAMHQLASCQDGLPRADHLDSLRGMEGAAASAYFTALAAVVPESLQFTHRNRRPPRDPFNVLLSLTYTLAHAEMAIALHGAGFDPCIGYYHQLSLGRESLACDLMETVRPLADRLCLHLVTTQVLVKDHFSHTSAGCLLGKAGRSRYYGAYEDNAAPLRHAIQESVQALRDTVCPEADAPWTGGPDDAMDETPGEMDENDSEGDPQA